MRIHFHCGSVDYQLRLHRVRCEFTIVQSPVWAQTSVLSDRCGVCATRILTSPEVGGSLHIQDEADCTGSPIRITLADSPMPWARRLLEFRLPTWLALHRYLSPS